MSKIKLEEHNMMSSDSGLSDFESEIYLNFNLPDHHPNRRKSLTSNTTVTSFMQQQGLGFEYTTT